jgi:hypothetical protein
MNNDQPCKHITQITTIKEPQAYICEECVKHGSQWVHLRTCQTCGITLCCDDSPLQHMTKHYHATSHPVIISAEPDEKWLWCYPDESFAEYQ